MNRSNGGVGMYEKRSPTPARRATRWSCRATSKQSICHPLPSTTPKLSVALTKKKKVPLFNVQWPSLQNNDSDSDQHQHRTENRTGTGQMPDRPSSQTSRRSSAQSNRSRSGSITTVRALLSPSTWAFYNSIRRRSADSALVLATETPHVDVIPFNVFMNNPLARRAFETHLEHALASENLLFLNACDELRCITIEQEPEKYSRVARDIFDDFIAADSEFEINIDSGTKDAIKKAVELHHDADDPQNWITDSTLYTAAEKQVLSMLERDCYPRFVLTPEYKQVADQITLKQSLPSLDKLLE